MKVPIKHHQGFTLVELMVGLVLGLIASLAIFSALSAFETQRRITSSGAEMQQNGLLALYSIEQDIRSAGFGLIDTTTTPGGLPCTKINAYEPPSVFDAAPVIIKVDDPAGSDSITIHRFDSDTGGIVTGGNAGQFTVSNSLLTLNTSKAIHNNDFLLLSQGDLDCSLVKVSAVDIDGTVNVKSTGNSGGDIDRTPSAFPNYGANPAVTAIVINLGQDAPVFATTKYQIDSHYDLLRAENGDTVGKAVANNIVMVASQYGVSAAGTQAVNCWTDATGASCSGTNWASPTPAEIRRIKAIRVAIVARSAQRTTCNNDKPQWFGGTLDISAVPDWACYRYKVYQTVIPIRNVIWGNLE